MKTIAQEDYLKQIYKLSNDNNSASTCDLAEFLEIKPASVTNMLKKLSTTTPPLVHYKKHQGATLTKEGRQIALKVIRRHRLIEMFLYQNLNYRWDEVHEEAELLEHAVSPEFVEKLADLLGNPSCDPHGQAIPNQNLELVESTAVPLAQFKAGETAVLKYMLDHNSAHLRKLNSLNLLPNTTVSIANIDSETQTIFLKLKDTSDLLSLEAEIAQTVFAEGVSNEN